MVAGRTTVLVLVLTLFAGAVAAADATKSSIHGTVVDAASGAPVVDATVVIVAPAPAAPVSVRTSAKGEYSTSDLAPGRYAVTVAYGDTHTSAEAIDVDGGVVRLDLRVNAQRIETIVVREKLPPPPKVEATPTERYERLTLPYSSEAIDTDAWKVAWLLLAIDDMGAVTGVTFLHRPGIGLDEIASEQAFKLRFHPARDDEGRAVASHVLWKMEWLPYWPGRVNVGYSKTGDIPCANSGRPLDLGAFYPSYRDCSEPDWGKLATEREIKPPPRRASR